MLICQSCGQENPDGFQFCGACAAPLTTDSPAPRTERKVVTVLFCDLVGSTARADRLDPEDVGALLSRYHAGVRAELERFGGTVEKFIGDAVVAVFGAPNAHEDDPERAVRAALAVRRWASQSGHDLRIAVNSGEALVTLGARPDQGEGMVAGDVVNVAARLQGVAPTNGILVGETTYRATRESIDYREARAVEVKGKPEPIPVWEALDARTTEELSGQPRTPLVGRERELRLLDDMFERVKAESAPQLVTIVGAPGIGKTRIVSELRRQVEETHDVEVRWRQGRSLPYGERGSFWALAEVVKAQLGVLETDSGAAVQEAIHTTVAELIGDDARVELHLGELLGVEGGMRLDADRDDAFAAWRRFFEAVAERGPLVLVFDDLHWADEDLLEFIDYLVEWTSRVPILILATTRPELLERRPGWGGGKLNSSTLAVSPLTEIEAARLIGALLERTLLEADTQAALLDRIGGNPLYAEQYALLYREQESVAELPLPEGVQGTIAARLDLLPEHEKGILQQAAVVGEVFWAGALRGDVGHVGRTLHALERKDFVRRRRRSSVEGDEEYAFTHLLVCDVAYGQIPRALRAEAHRLTAAWIESLESDRGDHAELLADHYVRALDLARASGDVRPDDDRNARVALRRAADHAMRLAAFERAAGLYETALGLAPSRDERPRLLLAYGRALQRRVDDRAEAVLAEASLLLAEQGEVEAAGEAEAVLAEFLWFHDSDLRAAAHAGRAVDLLRESPSSFAKAHALSNLARIDTFTGNIADAVVVAEEAAAIAGDVGSDEILAHALNSLGTAKSMLGDPSGLADLERAVELALAAKSPEVFRAYNNLAGTLDLFGDVERAERLWEDAAVLAEQIAIPHWIELVSRARVSFFRDGKWDALLAGADGNDDLFEFSFVHLARGDLDAARRSSSKLSESARLSGRIDFLAIALAMQVLVLSATQDSHASEAVDELVSLLHNQIAVWGGFAPLLAIALVDVGRGDALVAASDEAPPGSLVEAARKYASNDLVAGAEAFARLRLNPLAALARLRAGERLAAEGRQPEADRQLAQALEFFRKAGATAWIREAETLLAATA